MLTKLKLIFPNEKKIRSNISLTFFGVYLIMMFATLVYAYWIPTNKVFFGMIPDLSTLFLIIGCLISVLMRKPSQSYLIYGSLIILGIVVRHESTIAFPLWFFLILLMLSDIEFTKIVKVFFYVTAPLTIFTLTMGYFRLIPTMQSPRGIGPNGVVIWRQGLGFNWVTLPSQLLFYLTLSYFFLRKGMVSWKAIGIITVLDIFLYVQTDTRNPFLLVLLIVLVAGLLNSKYKDNLIDFFCGKIFGVVSIAAFSFFLIVSLILSYLGTDGFVLDKINRLMSNRVLYSHIGIERYGIQPFGTKVVYNVLNPTHNLKGSYFYLDNSYMQYLITFGIIFIVIIVGLLTIQMFKEYKNKKWYVLFIFVLIALHSTGDPQMMYISYSPFVLIIGKVIDKFKIEV
ncbi:hypothetical protein BGL46_03850 [Fructilactobacillus sanfranciscensis]|nr:hypothetical protein BGL46_03850 [Fructilactobacillus sanfranciscensis]